MGRPSPGTAPPGRPERRLSVRPPARKAADCSTRCGWRWPGASRGRKWRGCFRWSAVIRCCPDFEETSRDVRTAM